MLCPVIHVAPPLRSENAQRSENLVSVFTLLFCPGPGLVRGIRTQTRHWVCTGCEFELYRGIRACM